MLGNLAIAEELDAALELSVFNRCQLSLKLSGGYVCADDENIRSTFEECVSVIRKHNVPLILSVSCYQDRANEDNRICVHEAGLSRSQEKLTRICPFHATDYRDRLQEIIHRARTEYAREASDRIHLAYFRYAPGEIEHREDSYQLKE